MSRLFLSTIGAAVVLLACPGSAGAAVSPRDLLTQAAFADRTREQALAHIDQAERAAAAAMQRSPADSDAAILHATATGYRAKLLGSRSEAIAARKRFEDLVRRYPGNAEAQAALGAWHVAVVAKYGQLMGGAALGARKSVGLNSLNRATALGGDRAFFPAFAGLMRLELDADDSQAQHLTEAATRASAPTAVDRIFQRVAAAVLQLLRAGNRKGAQAIAEQRLPLGRID